jgi:starch phosphorylase
VLQEEIPGNYPANYPALGQPIDELALAEIKGAILAKLRLAIGKDAGMATRRDWYKAAALALRDRIVHRWLTAEKQSYDAGSKRVYYLSLEFLIGRLFTDALNNMGLLPVFEAALGDLGVGLDDLRKCEPDAALGNGGLGRLAACFMESMWRRLPFRHRLRHPLRFRPVPPDHFTGLAARISGRMVEFWQPLGIPARRGRLPHPFRRFCRPRRRPRPRPRHLASGRNRAGCRLRHPDRRLARPARNALRLWSARSPDPLRLDVFNTGDYLGAVAEEARAESICKFLYPNDESPAGRELRLRQEYFSFPPRCRT